MNATHSLAVLNSAEPVAWLLVLVAMYLCGERRSVRLNRGGLSMGRFSEAPPDYRPLGAFVVLKLLASLLYPVLVSQKVPLGLSPYAAHLLSTSLYWVLYMLATVSIFFVIASLLRKSLSPLPGLSSAAVIIFRWSSVLAFTMALTAHLPVFGVRNVPLWLDEVSVSFALCVCTFEIALLALLLMRLERLGMCLRSRPVGLALGLTMLGIMDLVSAVTLNMADRVLIWVGLVNEVVVLLALTTWVYYIIMPEPRRLAHSLSPASKLMRWNEIALKLDLSGRQAEPAPFISGVESVVVGIMKKYNIGSS